MAVTIHNFAVTAADLHNHATFYDALLGALGYRCEHAGDPLARYTAHLGGVTPADDGWVRLVVRRRRSTIAVTGPTAATAAS